MKKLTAIAFAFVLALAILGPASAVASAGETDRSIHATGSGTIHIDTAAGTFSGDATGSSSQLGRYRLHVQGAGALAQDGSFVGTGTMTMVAANGDRLTGTIQVTSSDGRTTVVVDITGGTGRFAGATGDLTVECRSGPPVQQGATLTFTIECAATGRISL